MPDRRRPLRCQAIYYCVTGVVPLVSMRTFEAVTGTKRDRWLVQMVGLLAISIGSSLWFASCSDEIEPPTLALSCMSALAFAGIDIVHAYRRRISQIYFVDAAIELAFVSLMLR